MPFFEIIKRKPMNNIVPEVYAWQLRQGSVQNPGPVVAVQGPSTDLTEKDCRSSVANAKKVMGGAKMAKVVVA